MFFLLLKKTTNKANIRFEVAGTFILNPVIKTPNIKLTNVNHRINKTAFIGFGLIQAGTAIVIPDAKIAVGSQNNNASHLQPPKSTAQIKKICKRNADNTYEMQYVKNAKTHLMIFMFCFLI